jgi:hypothetical protein
MSNEHHPRYFILALFLTSFDALTKWMITVNITLVRKAYFFLLYLHLFFSWIDMTASGDIFQFYCSNICWSFHNKKLA